MEPPRHDRALHVHAKPEAVAGAGHDRDDVLEESAKIDAGLVAVNVDAEHIACEDISCPLKHRAVFCRDDKGCRNIIDDLVCNRRAGHRNKTRLVRVWQEVLDHRADGL